MDDFDQVDWEEGNDRKPSKQGIEQPMTYCRPRVRKPWLVAGGRRTAGGKGGKEQESVEGTETKRKNRLLGSDGLVRFPSCKVAAKGRMAWHLRDRLEASNERRGKI